MLRGDPTITFLWQTSTTKEGWRWACNLQGAASVIADSATGKQTESANARTVRSATQALLSHHMMHWMHRWMQRHEWVMISSRWQLD